MARWSVQLFEFSLQPEKSKGIRGQAIAYLLAAFLGCATTPFHEDIPVAAESKSWLLYFDGSSHGDKGGSGVVLITPDDELISKDFKLGFPCTNNAAEYEAFLLGLKFAKDLGSQDIEVKGDSHLLIQQMLGEFSVKEPTLNAYRDKSQRLIGEFESVSLAYTGRTTNKHADALATLASSLQMINRRIQRDGFHWPDMVQQAQTLQDNCEACQGAPVHGKAFIIDGEDWRTPYIEYLTEGTLPYDKKAAKKLEKRAPKFFVIDGELFRRCFNKKTLKCVDQANATRIMEISHDGEHQGKARLFTQIHDAGYYWPTMESDITEYVEKCEQFQIHGNLIHAPHTMLQDTCTPCPFHSWGLDIIGPINPKSSKQHEYIITATEYFTKWVEAIPLKGTTGEVISAFIKEHIVCRFGIPMYIISDNGTPFVNSDVTKLLRAF
ncbi:uncharacterized protein LOC113272768 [Papaver somniferum]|uniref:uncharacterized protein LOC113272768 n=1 Tax=Papaver somniferum TaxID=3469 RepID=UPI000E6F9D56|nr:uncharacterized protein LOC113272768 [Papaver somniferum]